jgi:hypothetical protein
MAYTQAISLLERGVARPTLYSVRLGNRVSERTNSYLNFFCERVSIPEVRYNTIIAPGHEYMGITRDMPTAAIYGKPLTMRVIENKNFDIYRDLRRWFDSVGVNINQPGAITGGGNGRTQRMNYYETFTSDIEIIKLECKDNTTPSSLLLGEGNDGMREVLRVKFINAYPTNVGQIDMSSDDRNSYLAYDVQFTYESYHVTSLSGSIGAFLG